MDSKDGKELEQPGYATTPEKLPGTDMPGIGPVTREALCGCRVRNIAGKDELFLCAWHLRFF